MVTFNVSTYEWQEPRIEEASGVGDSHSVDKMNQVTSVVRRQICTYDTYQRIHNNASHYVDLELKAGIQAIEPSQATSVTAPCSVHECHVNATRLNCVVTFITRTIRERCASVNDAR